MNTLYLTPSWDLTSDAFGNIALATEPYALAQDAASAIRTFQGEVYYDTTQGVPYWAQILGQAPPLALVRSKMIDAALTVPGVTAAAVFFSSFSGRALAGQVQVTSATTGQTTAAGFEPPHLQPGTTSSPIPSRLDFSSSLNSGFIPLLAGF